MLELRPAYESQPTAMATPIKKHGEAAGVGGRPCYVGNGSPAYGRAYNARRVQNVVPGGRYGGALYGRPPDLHQWWPAEAWAYKEFLYTSGRLPTATPAAYYLYQYTVRHSNVLFFFEHFWRNYTSETVYRGRSTTWSPWRLRPYGS